MGLHPVRGSRGMVAAGHPLAAEEGLAVLRSGGNAVDAAVAAAATLSVVSPHECGLGGDLLSLIYDTRERTTYCLNASGKSPAAATRERYAYGMPSSGALSVSVPGMVGGWAAALSRFGTCSLDTLLTGAIRFSEQGVPVYEALMQNALERRERICAHASSKAVFFPGGHVLRPGDVLCQPGAAMTLRAISKEGADAFYQGSIAEALAACVQSAGGILTVEDLAGFQPVWQEPVEASFSGHSISTMPPNSWGIALLLQLALLERDGIAASDEAAFVLQGIRARRRAYALLAGAVADPEVVGDEARDRLARCLASGQAPETGAVAAAVGGSDTSQVLVVDAAGNAVSLLQSIFSPFGSGLLCAETGVLLNNRMLGFSTDVSDRNCVGPRKRPAQTLAPALARKDGAVSILCATPGGPGQTGTLAQFLARVLARGESLCEAIAASRWSINLEGELILEDSMAEPLRHALLAAEPALRIMRHGAINFGSIVAIVRHRDEWLGCADARRNAAVNGF